MKGHGREVSQAELAAIFGVSAATVRAWVRHGAPVITAGGKGRAARYNTAQVAAWRDARAREAAGTGEAIDLAEAQRRKTAAQAGKAELDLRLRTGAVVEIDEVVRQVAEEYGVVRSRLLAIPVTVAPLVAAEASPAKCKAIIDREIAVALAELTAAPKHERP